MLPESHAHLKNGQKIVNRKKQRSFAKTTNRKVEGVSGEVFDFDLNDQGKRSAHSLQEPKRKSLSFMTSYKHVSEKFQVMMAIQIMLQWTVIGRKSLAAHPMFK